MNAQPDVDRRTQALLRQPWYTVDPPWGDGTRIIAGTNDPHGGIFVCDCEPMVWGDDEDDAPDPGAVARHIAQLHNAALAVRRLLR